MKEVALHNAPPSIWSVYNGAVYDITMYVNCHPGGTKMLEKVYGKDYHDIDSYIKLKYMVKIWLDYSIFIYSYLFFYF